MKPRFKVGDLVWYHGSKTKIGSCFDDGNGGFRYYVNLAGNTWSAAESALGRRVE